MEENLKTLLDDFKAFDTIVIHRHFNPDGDAVGSQTGLKYLLNDNYPDKKVYIVGDPAERYSFIDGSATDDIPDGVYENALAVILDSATPDLVSDDRYRLAKKTARIDHHMFVAKFCDDEVVDSSFESCAGLIGYIAREGGLKLSQRAAKSLYTGMVTDSGRFMYDSTNSRTFEIAAYLTATGFKVSDIYNNLYQDDLNMVRLRATFALKAKFTEHNVGYIYTDYAEFLTYGVSSFTISRGMVNTMAQIKGVDIWVNFTETENSVLCELRSTKYNINKIAVAHGGGGHILASGATLKDKNEAFEMLAELDALVANGETL